MKYVRYASVPGSACKPHGRCDKDRTMNISQKLSAALLLLAGGLVLVHVTPATARGGGSNIMMSPGYQRALEESRHRYQESDPQPRVQPSTAHKRKKPRHHNTRH